MFTDGPRLENGAAGYAVCWKHGLSWVGRRVLKPEEEDASESRSLSSYSNTSGKGGREEAAGRELEGRRVFRNPPLHYFPFCR